MKQQNGCKTNKIKWIAQQSKRNGQEVKKVKTKG